VDTGDRELLNNKLKPEYGYSVSFLSSNFPT